MILYLPEGRPGPSPLRTSSAATKGLASTPPLVIVEAASGAQTVVGGPPPPVTWLANDKAVITDLTNALCDDGILGAEATAETRITTDANELAAALALE